jgi:hypothetical protein
MARLLFSEDQLEYGQLFPVEFAMDNALAEMFATQYTWVPLPDLKQLLPVADRLYQDLLSRLAWDDVLAGRYTWHHQDTYEPDDGIIVKRSADTSDPSCVVHGVPPDNKVFIQLRPRTRRMFMAAGGYEESFTDFFDVTDEIRRRLDARVQALLPVLRRSPRVMGPIHYDHANSVLRLMRYDAPRPDASGLAGKPHTDRVDVTLHLWDSEPGLVLLPWRRDDVHVPTRPGEALMFVSDGLSQRTTVPALRHAALHAAGTEPRRIIVFFMRLMSQPA